MPLPKVKPNENEQTYVSRCISYEKRQDTDMSDEQIKAACYERYRTSKKEDKADLHNITKEDIVNIGTKIAKEIIKRKEAGDMDYTVSEDKSKPYKEFWQAITDNLTTSQINILTQEENTKEKINKKENKKEPSAKYYSDTSPYYRFYEEELEGNIKSAGWDDKKLLVDVKSDGLRLTVGKVNGEAFFYVDPEDVKEKDPNVTERLPNLKKEVEEAIPDDTILDAEFISIGPNGKEILHRTSTNSLLNSDIEAEKLEEYAAIFVFIPLFWNGEDLRDESLKNRLDYLDKIEETDNIFVERVSDDLSKEADAYIVDGGSISQIEKAFDKITNDEIGRPKYFAEGIMLKDLDHKYQTPTHHGWAKLKELFEMDLRILNKDQVKGSPGVYNYDMGLDINKEYYEVLISMGTKEWYGNTGVLTDDGKYYRGKESKDKEGQYIMEMGTSDNHKEETDVEVGDIYRIAAEEVLKFDNPEHPKYPRYSFYIGVPLEPIPERETTDDIEVVDKLAGFQPKRISSDELARIEAEDLEEEKMLTTISSPEMLKPESIAGKPKEDGDKRVGELPRSEWESKSDLPEEIHIKGIDTVQEFLNILTQYAEISKEDVKKWVEDGKIPEDIYKKIAKEEKPLPDKLYPRDISGKHRSFCQMHVRGVPEEEFDKWDNGDLSISEMVKDHSLHMDLRLWFGDNKEETQQWVITESSMKSYIRGMKGEIDPDTGNSQKCLVITKPSSEEPKDVEAKADEEEALLDEEGAKIVEKYAIEGTETILPPGDVGASPYKYAILFTTWTGKVAFGAQRPDLSEFWLYPDDDIPEKNKKLLDGKYIVRGFAPGGDKRWWFFKAKDHPKPMDSIDHSATGDFYPVPADELKKMGSDEYKKQSKKAFKDALS